MVKVVAWGDFHLHPFTEFAQVDEVTGNSRLTASLRCMQIIRRYCLDNDIKYAVDAGDLYHKRKAVDTETFNHGYNEIKEFGEAGINVIMIPGNHNQADNSDFPEHSLEQFKELKNVTVLDRFEPLVMEELIIFPVPYSKNAEMVKKELDKYAYDISNEGLEEKSILLGHLGISGAYVGKSSYAMADAFTVDDLFPEHYQFVVLGHFHKYQDLGGYNHVFYTGAPEQHNFNDGDQDKGFWVLDTETRTKEFVPLPSPKFITVTDWKNTDPKSLEGNFVRYQVPANEVDELTEALPEESQHRLEVQKDYHMEKRMDIDFSKSFEEIISAYAKEKYPEAEEIGLEIFREAQQNNN